jgi:hypothetical protein
VSASAAFAEGTAVVQRDRVNVRGGAGLVHEVVTQLRKGEMVVVLEPVVLARASQGEPTHWFKIMLPANTPVWVNANFVSSSNTVSGSRLNVRGGPGENYSVLARLLKGDAIQPIRTVDDWIEIHPPTNAVAFVAATYLAYSGPVAPVLAESPKSAETEAAPAPKPVVPAPEPARPVETAVVESETVAPATNTPVAAPLGASEPAPNATAAPVVTAPVVPPANSAPVEISPAAPRRRIVVREGILRRDFHINTPGYFQLVDKYHGRLINYLYVSNPELDLGPFVGSVVIVRGEEYLDERWKRTPVIEVEHATLPN